MDKIQEITHKMRNVIRDHPLAFLTERNDYLYSSQVDDYNVQKRKAFDGNRGALLASVLFVAAVLVAIVSAII